MERTFNSWVRRRQRLDGIIPQADKVVPLVVGAGTAGMTPQQLGHVIKLDRAVLDELLDGLVRAGLLNVTWVNGSLVFRSASSTGHDPPS